MQILKLVVVKRIRSHMFLQRIPMYINGGQHKYTIADLIFFNLTFFSTALKHNEKYYMNIYFFNTFVCYCTNSNWLHAVNEIEFWKEVELLYSYSLVKQRIVIISLCLMVRIIVSHISPFLSLDFITVCT